jgi:hypothetical protein
MPTDAAGLAALLRRGAESLSSAHLAMGVTASGEQIRAVGDETLSAGKLTSMDLSETIPGLGDIELILADGKTYAKLPSALNHSGKPWVLVRADSADSVVRTLASSLSTVQSSASLDTFPTFTAAAKSVTSHGPAQVSGVAATHYSIVVDTTKLPDSMPGKQALVAAGVTTLPLELWIDAQGRTVKVSQDLSVQGHEIRTTVLMTKFDAPVSISAPPASQVSTD